jgi:D-alanine-D-alanine ligase
MSARPKCPTTSPAAMMDMAARRTGCSAARARRAPTSAGTTSRARPGIYLLEVNTQPGMTPLSLVPEQAKLKGISYGELVERLIAEALE